MAEPVIELEHVSAGYPGVEILGDVTFSVNEGEIFVLLGGSGCGKSTIMRHMIGLNPVLGGTMRVLGMEMNRKNRPKILRRIGVMYQSGALFGNMTCLQNVMLPLEEFTKLGRKARREKAQGLLDQVGLADAAGKMPSEISGGMKKRVAIARALALDPDEGDLLHGTNAYTPEVDGASHIQPAHVVAEVRLHKIFALLAAHAAQVHKHPSDQHNAEDNERADLRKICLVVVCHVFSD